MPESLARWVGGKKRLMPLLSERFAPHLTDGVGFNDLFVGSGAVTFGLLDRGLLPGCPLIRYADTSPEVRALFSLTLADPANLLADFIHLARQFPPHTDYLAFRDYYNDARQQRLLDDYLLAAGLIYISRFGFNGLWRVNRKGECNVPPGSACQSEEAVEAVVGLIVSRCREWFDSQLVFPATMGCADYNELLDEAVCSTNRQVVYADPPYHKTFNGYSKAGSFDTPRLIDRLEHLNVDQFTVFLSNSPDALPLLTHGKWEVEMVSRSESVSCNGAGRQRVSEVLARRV